MTHKTPLTKQERIAFEQTGYHVVNSLFTATEVSKWKKLIDLATRREAGRLTKKTTHTLADGVTTQEPFWDIIFTPELLATIRQLIGNEIRYTQHSDLHINLPGGRWHRDNAHRSFGVGPDWDEIDAPYRVVRVAIYLSDYNTSGSALHVLPGSHRNETVISRLEYVIWNKIRTYLRKYGCGNFVPHYFVSTTHKSIRTGPGDCVIFDQRLMHAGGQLHGDNPKYSIFLSFGLNNRHSINHRAFFLRRPTYCTKIPPALRKRLKEQELLLLENIAK